MSEPELIILIFIVFGIPFAAIICALFYEPKHKPGDPDCD